MMNKLFKVMGGLLAAVAMMLGFLGVGTAHADEVIDNAGITEGVLEDSLHLYGELDARYAGVGLDDRAGTLWVRFVVDRQELSVSQFQPRQRNVYQLPVNAGKVTWEVYHISRPAYILAAGYFDLRFSDAPFKGVYQEEGYLDVNSRYWHTECEPYSQTTRCRTDIAIGDNEWAFNNLTYSPSPRSLWANNPLGGYGKVGNVSSWTAANGRQWRVECDTAATGRGGCRSYIKTGSQWVFNNIVLFN